MTAMTLEAHLSAPVSIDLCPACQAFWFDKYESLKLAPASTLKLIKFISEHSSTSKASVSKTIQCPRCAIQLRFTHDLQKNTPFTYWRCTNEHGRFIGYFDFLREKSFIKALTAQQIDELRQNIQTVNCSSCGAPVDLASGSACTHCGSPISMLDMKQPQQLLDQLKEASQPKSIDPALPLELARAKRDVESLFGAAGPPAADWWSNASSSGLVEAGLMAFAKWLTRSGI